MYLSTLLDVIIIIKLIEQKSSGKNNNMASFWEAKYDYYPLFSLFIIFTCPTLFSIFLFLFRGKNADIVDEKRRTVLRQVLLHVIIVALQKHWQCIENSFWAIFLIYFTQPDIDSQQKLPSRTKTVTKTTKIFFALRAPPTECWGGGRQ